MGNEQTYSYIKEIAMRLKDSRKFGAASVMIGAGFSKNAKSKGMENVQPPNWSELADKMYCELYTQSEKWDEKRKKEWERQRIIKTSGKNVTKLAEEYIANFDRNRINHLIETAISDDLFFPGELHKKLLRLCWADIFTTNYDTLLEQTSDLIFRESNYQIVYSQNDLPGSIKPRIVKLHGSIPQIKPYVICDEDYRTYPIKYPAMVNTVQQAMLETRLCLIGFSGDDPNFQSWLGWLRDNMGEYCPKIYLIGIYDNLSEPERKLLENKQITIVDISDLVYKEDSNRYYTAISEFLDLLEKFQEDEELNIYKERPFPREDRFWEPEDKIEYIRIMDLYLDRVLKWMQPYILIPDETRQNYENYFYDHFQVILKKCKEQPPVNTISKVIKILRKCSVALYDDSSIEILEQICKTPEAASNLDNNILKSIIEINLYLLEMYRINGRKSDYKEKMCQLEEFVDNAPWYKNEVVIEKIKSKIESFRYEEAKHLIDKIEESSFEYKIKKAGFYKQLSEATMADGILNKCSAELAQMKLSDDIYSSYLGYLNLCYRVGSWAIPNEYSDLNYYENEYNTRRIMVKQREVLSQDFFKRDYEEEKNIPFNINTGSTTHTILSSDNLYKKCFCFLITLDKLCLPLFSDQIELLPSVINKLINYSDSKYWIISFIIRANNEKVIEQMFTRKAIQTIFKGEGKQLFDSLLDLVKLYKSDDNYKQKKYIVSIINILNVLSRVVVFLSDEDVGKYLKLLCEFSQNVDSFVINDIRNILNRISTRFNSKIATLYQNVLFLDFGHIFHLCNYFSNFLFEIEEGHITEYYNNAIFLTEKGDLTERDCGISQLLVLWKNCPIKCYAESIKRALWQNKKDVLPPSNLYFQFVWEELPHPDSVVFSELYYSYLLKDRYEKSVTERGYIGNNSSDSVYNYLNFFYNTSNISLRKCEKVLLDDKLAAFMLDTAYDYVIHEKSLLERKKSLFGVREDAERKFELIGELVALIYIQAIMNEIIEPVRPKINLIKDVLVAHNIPIEALNIIEAIENKKYDLCMDIFENTILIKNKRNYSGVFIGIECLLFYLDFQKENVNSLNKSFEIFMGTIKFLDIEYAKTIWMEMGSLINRSFFTSENAQQYISKAICTCIKLYSSPAQDGERYYLDGLFNCVKALHGYYIRVSEINKVTTSELENCVEMAKSIENYEIRNIWN